MNDLKWFELKLLFAIIFILIGIFVQFTQEFKGQDTTVEDGFLINFCNIHGIPFRDNFYFNLYDDYVSGIELVVIYGCHAGFALLFVNCMGILLKTDKKVLQELIYEGK